MGDCCSYGDATPSILKNELPRLRSRVSRSLHTDHHPPPSGVVDLDGIRRALLLLQRPGVRHRLLRGRRLRYFQFHVEGAGRGRTSLLLLWRQQDRL